MDARQAACDLLLRWERSHRLADELWEAVSLPPAERSLATELFYGCLRHRLALDYLIDRTVPKSPRPVTRALLRLGLYQRLFLDRMAPHAAVHETVELAKHYLSPPEVRLLHAVLRNPPSREDLQAAPPWIRWSHPQWLWERWCQRWGEPSTIALCEWNNTPPPLYVRGDKPWPGVLEPTGLHPRCYRIVNAEAFFANPGPYYVQDPSTLVAVDMLDPQPGESVLDMCAAPGGKTTYIAEKMQHRGRIIAADSSSRRLQRVAENCRRLGIPIVATLACNGTHLDRCLRGERFDRVLLDAPCSNTGVMRRRPDLRWRLRPEEITRLARVQRALLATAFRFVRPGGVLVYSTCSLEREENEEQLQGLPPPCAHRHLFPPRDGMDGGFVAVWRMD